MAEYKINPTNISTNIDKIYSVISNPGKLKEFADRIPAEAREKLQGLEMDADSITFAAGPVGNVKMAITERIAPNKVVYSAQSSPVPVSLTLELEKVDESNTTLNGALNLEIPIFLKAMVDGKIKDALAKVSERLSQIPFDHLNID